MKKALALVAISSLLTVGACSKTESGDLEVEKPVVGTVTDTVSVPTLDVGTQTQQVAVPNVEVKTDSVTIKTPTIEIKR